MTEKSEREVVISESTKVPLGWVLGGFLTAMGVVITAVGWASSIQAASAANAKDVLSLSERVETIQKNIEIVKEAQIRMEAKMGMAPRYTRDTK